jgi:tRNA A64-2'-O-ribosylphosphate transferase
LRGATRRAQSIVENLLSMSSSASSDDDGSDGGLDDRAFAAAANGFTAASSLFAVQRRLHRDKHDLRNRLQSIGYDADTVAELARFFPVYPCLANLRQGAWYVDPALPSYGGTCYFKSTDGHAGQWTLNLRRLNLHVAAMAAQHGGVLIVDSTRGGKRYPDSLSKTVPAWACVLNRVVQRLRRDLPPATVSSAGTGWADNAADADDVALPLCVAPTVAPTEANQIECRLDGWVAELAMSAADLMPLAAVLRKPLKPVWYAADSLVVGNMLPDFDTLPFTPVICVMASETAHPKRGDFVYGQGAADDEEGWSCGLGAPAFWRNRCDLLAQQDNRGVETLVRQLLAGENEAVDVRGTSGTLGGGCTVADSVALAPEGGWESGATSVGSAASGRDGELQVRSADGVMDDRRLRDLRRPPAPPLTGLMPTAEGHTFVAGTRVAVGTATFGGSAAAHKEFDVVINCGCERRPASGGSPASVEYLSLGVRPACHHTGYS